MVRLSRNELFSLCIRAFQLSREMRKISLWIPTPQLCARRKCALEPEFHFFLTVIYRHNTGNGFNRYVHCLSLGKWQWERENVGYLFDLTLIGVNFFFMRMSNVHRAILQFYGYLIFSGFVLHAKRHNQMDLKRIAYIGQMWSLASAWISINFFCLFSI